MSMTLYWKPQADRKLPLSDDLLRVLRDGKFKIRPESPCHIIATHAGYFEALADAGIAGAREVFDALERYRAIVVSID